MMIVAIVILLLNILFLTVSAVNAYEYEEEPPELFEVWATAYCDGEITSTQCKVREGIIAGKPDWYGKVACIYESNNGEIGEFLGYYEVLDTGGEAIKNGRVIDIYNPSKEWCDNFGRHKVFIHLVEGDG